MVIKKVGKIIIMMLIFSTFVACGKLQNNDKLTTALDSAVNTYEVNLPENIKYTDMPSHIEISEGKVNIDAEVIAPEKAYFIKGEYNAACADNELFEDVIIKPYEADYEVEKSEIEIKRNNGITVEDLQILHEKSYVIYDKEGQQIAMGISLPPEYASFNTSWGSSYTRCIKQYEKYKNIPGEYNLNVYQEKKEFSFATETEALEQVTTMLSQIGIQIGDYEVDTYYLDYKSLEENEKTYDKDGNEQTELYKENKLGIPWNEEDNAYLFYIHQVYFGLRDYHDETTRLENGLVRPEASTAQVTAIVNKQGIQFIEMDNIGSYITNGESCKLLELSEVVERVLQHYNSILDENTYYIDTVVLYIDQVNSADTLVPVWGFFVTENNNDVPVLLRVNAINGRIE